MLNLRKSIDSYLDRRLPHIVSHDIAACERLALCRRFGDFSLAYSTAVQPDLKYFGDSDGYIAYGTKMGYIFALGDPVAAPAQRADYIRRFVAAAKRPCFVQMDRDSACTLSSLGYRINHIGIDTGLCLGSHSFSGGRNETIRYSEKWLFKNGFSIVECDGTGKFDHHVAAISDNWRAGRVVSRREMRFLNRPFRVELSPDMRRFILLDPAEEPVALLDFDPMFRNGEIFGYTTAFKRKSSGTTSHAEVGLTKFAANRFQEEGHSLLTLGLSPLAAIVETGFAESPIWRRLHKRAFASRYVNERIFNVQGQAAFKRRFHGNEFPTYIGFKRGSPAEMIALLRLMKTL
ncbi:phosphatidylglycerol lysyltransferase domain-containing protein [Rhizobium tubonense]|uniref:Phosphatidylglycerol lysyltransferase C-terminal domain-containing protein n=1 Tax=Rhizobium tubonense TaxID=484088 RepID=A0A2W4CXM4_9HYPH|nr:phosphatidylglycerol lysyltransferase domain-containing protein [Rhizobium tubonense]PZM10044.1 hypothetical protein CPY51_24085 [Rhizobium tubonense]